ncbi:MAG: hypothetical protein R3A47_12560 [Polyangiales bacterium]
MEIVPKQTYPLKAVIEVREADVDRATTALSAARRNEDKAAAAMDDARKALSEFDDETKLQRVRHNEMTAKGITVDEMLLATAHFDKRKQVASELADAIVTAKRALSAASKVTEAASKALADARVELRVVEKHRETWREEQRSEALAKAELEQEDVFAGRRR